MLSSVPNTTCYGLAGEVEWLVHLAPQRTVGELEHSLGAYAIMNSSCKGKLSMIQR